MNAFEKIKEKLEEENKFAVSLLNGKTDRYVAGVCDANKKALSIVSEIEAECGNGWIPCGERMPKANERMKVWVTVAYPYARHTRRAYWTGWCFEWENGKQINADMVLAWKQYHAPEPWKGE